jgi:tetratricopeptide (TPR) repeat protein
VQFEKENKLAEAITEYSEIKKIAPKAKKELIDKKISVLMSKIKSSVKSLTAAADEAYAAKLYKKALLKYTEVLKYDERNGKALNGITKINSKIDEDKQKYLDMAKQNRSGNEKKAISYYKKAIELDPNNEEANKGIESLTGKQSSAVLDAQKIRSLYYEGVDKYVNGEVESAIRIWKQVLAMDPNHAEAKKNIKRAEEKLLAIKNLSR